MNIRSALEDNRRKRLITVHKHPHVKAIVNVLGTFPEPDRDASVSKLEKRVPGLSRKQVIAAARKLAAPGLADAEFKCGRRGSESRITHPVSLRRIYDAFEGAAAGIETAPAKRVPRLVTHAFHLRPDLDVKFDLPEDLTKDEASRLGGLLAAIPL